MSYFRQDLGRLGNGVTMPELPDGENDGGYEDYNGDEPDITYPTLPVEPDRTRGGDDDDEPSAERRGGPNWLLWGGVAATTAAGLWFLT